MTTGARDSRRIRRQTLLRFNSSRRLPCYPTMYCTVTSTLCTAIPQPANLRGPVTSEQIRTSSWRCRRRSCAFWDPSTCLGSCNLKSKMPVAGIYRSAQFNATSLQSRRRFPNMAFGEACALRWRGGRLLDGRLDALKIEPPHDSLATAGSDAHRAEVNVAMEPWVLF